VIVIIIVKRYDFELISEFTWHVFRLYDFPLAFGWLVCASLSFTTIKDSIQIHGPWFSSIRFYSCPHWLSGTQSQHCCTQYGDHRNSLVPKRPLLQHPPSSTRPL